MSDSVLAVDEENTQCPNCDGTAPRVMDHSAGDYICTGCGEVLMDRCFDEGREWRNFASEGVGSANDHDASSQRADALGATDELTGELASTTILGASNEIRRMQKTLLMADRAHCTLNKDEKTLKTYASKLRDLARVLALHQNIIARSVNLLKHLCETHQLKGWKKPAWFNAIVYLACREERVGRTIKELANASAGAANKKELDFEREIARQIAVLRKQLSGQLQEWSMQAVGADELTARFVNRLQLSPTLEIPAIHIANMACRWSIVRARNQSSLVACAILIVAWLADVEDKPSFSDVAVAAKVPDSSVITIFQQIRPHVTKVLPPNFQIKLPIEKLDPPRS